MPMSLYKFKNLLKWTWFKDLNLNIYMMHKIIYKKNIRKSHGLLNSKLMNCTYDFHFYVNYATIHWLMGCVKDLELVRYHIKETHEQNK
jgi:hypothetical protein